eukprot:TRINITY_DN57726_c0_g1_i1.p1 TRINITY_DN57726_c0_g1~~TRINITY_DN57726_c0_g1_i1.p1  ORF type:complete len:809 (+),score=117.27 TRINITY_DN57726_c0_g1_i1:72-2429(+)
MSAVRFGLAASAGLASASASQSPPSRSRSRSRRRSHGGSLSSSDTSSSSSPQLSSAPSTEDEDTNNYRNGGFCEVRPGDNFDEGRYEAIAKLGWGNFSTVWLCRRTDGGSAKTVSPDACRATCANGTVSCKNGTSDGRCTEGGGPMVAIKVVKSAKKYRNVALDEVRLLAAVRCGVSDGSDVGRCVIALLDHFDHHSPTGSVHPCLVLERVGPTALELAFQNGGRLPYPLVLAVARDALKGLDLLHQRCKILHTDLKPENIMLRCDGPLAGIDLLAPVLPPERAMGGECEANVATFMKTAAAAKAALSAVASRIAMPTGVSPAVPFTAAQSPTTTGSTPTASPCTQVFAHSETPGAVVDTSVPTRMRARGRKVAALAFRAARRAGVSARFTVGDLGNGCLASRPVSDFISTCEYKSPEVLLGAGYDASTDIWSLGCTLFELATGRYLLDPRCAQRGSSRLLVAVEEDEEMERSADSGAMNKDRDEKGREGSVPLEEEHLAQITALSGPPSEELLARGRLTSRFFSREVPKRMNGGGEVLPTSVVTVASPATSRAAAVQVSSTVATLEDSPATLAATAAAALAAVEVATFAADRDASADVAMSATAAPPTERVTCGDEGDGSADPRATVAAAVTEAPFLAKKAPWVFCHAPRVRLAAVPRQDLRARLDRFRRHLSVAAVGHLERLLTPMLVVEPSVRASAKELLALDLVPPPEASSIVRGSWQSSANQVKSAVVVPSVRGEAPKLVPQRTQLQPSQSMPPPSQPSLQAKRRTRWGSPFVLASPIAQ